MKFCSTFCLVKHLFISCGICEAAEVNSVVPPLREESTNRKFALSQQISFDLQNKRSNSETGTACADVKNDKSSLAAVS